MMIWPDLCGDAEGESQRGVAPSSNTNDLTGEYEDRYFVATRGDSRIAVTVARNKDTIKMNRQTRFLIDEPEDDFKLAYALTKPLKVGLTYDKGGIYKFVMQEVYTTDYDNIELGIADYYRYYPKESVEPSGDDSGKKVWL